MGASFAAVWLAVRSWPPPEPERPASPAQRPRQRAVDPLLGCGRGRRASIGFSKGGTGATKGELRVRHACSPFRYAWESDSASGIEGV
jgi:hypothetical protein